MRVRSSPPGGSDELASLLRQRSLLETQKERLRTTARSLREGMPQNHAAQLKFLHAELETGNTFATVALASGRAQKRERNRLHAELALQSFCKYRKQVRLTSAESTRLSSKLRELRSKLRKLARKPGESGDL